MADSAINGFAVQENTVPNNSFFGFDWFDGIGWQTVKILSEDLAAQLGAYNMANANLTLSGNRSHDADSYTWTLGKAKDITLEAFIAPTLGRASINLNGFGSTAADVTHRFKASGGATIAEMYGDLGAKFNGSIGVNIVPDGIVSCWHTIQSTDTKRPLLVNSTSTANAATFQANAGYAVVASGNGSAAVYATNSAGNWGVWGASDGAAAKGVYGTSNGGTAVWGNGGGLFETWNLNSARNANAVLQANSTTQGFLPPRMTSAQRTTIAVGAADYGLIVYQTDATEGLYIYKSTGWTFII